MVKAMRRRGLTLGDVNASWPGVAGNGLGQLHGYGVPGFSF